MRFREKNNLTADEVKKLARAVSKISKDANLGIAGVEWTKLLLCKEVLW